MSIVKKLRAKFVIVATASVFVLLLLILGSINISNFALVASDADAITEKIAGFGGSFPTNAFSSYYSTSSVQALYDDNAAEATSESRPEETAPQGENSTDQGEQFPGGDNPQGPSSVEVLASIRYFTYRFDESMTGEEITLNMSLVDSSEALEWSFSLVGATSSIGWTRTYYRYRLYELEDSGVAYTYVTIIDESRELAPSYRVLWGSLIGSGIGLFAAFVAIFFISKTVFKPLEESQRRQKRFISNASHELKTPLAIISANAEILEIEYGDNESTTTIARQVKKLNEMVKNLNALAKIDEIEKVTLGTFSLSDAVYDVASGFLKAFANKGKTLTLDIQEGVAFKGDEAMMRQLTSVILDNALKYADSHAEFSLTEHDGRITIEEHNDCKDVVDGPLDSLFERFYRSEEVRASSIEGSGIGLSIAKEVVGNHHGRISAYGENGIFHIKADF